MRIIPQTIRTFRFNSVFVRILSFFIGLVLLSILIVGCVSYYNSANLMVEEVKNSNLILLKQARDILDQEVGILDKLSLQVGFDTRVNKVYYIDGEELVRGQSQNVHYFNDIRGYLSGLKSSAGFISSIWVYFNKSNIVISDQGKYDAGFFFQEVNTFLPKDKWDKLLGEYSPFKVLERNDPSGALSQAGSISFIRTLPVTETTPYASVVVNVNENVFKSLIGNVNHKSPATVCVVDIKGNVLVSNQVENGADLLGMNELQEVAGAAKARLKDQEGFITYKIRNRQYTIAVTSSSYNGWTYLAVIPTGFIMSKAAIIRNTTLVVIAVSLFVSLILSYVITRRIYSPISKILDYIGVLKDLKVNKESKGPKDELSFINQMISYVYNEYKDIENTMNRNLPALREKFLSDLLNGRNLKANWDEVNRSLVLDLSIESYYVVAVFEAEGYYAYMQHYHKGKSRGMEQEIELISESEAYKGLKILIVKKTEDIAVALINLAEEPSQPEVIYDFIKDIAARFQETYGLSVTTGVGRMYESADNVSESYIEALKALEYKVVKGTNSIIQIDEVTELPESSFDYPIEKEQQIINLVKSGDLEGLNLLLNELFAKNIDRSGVSLELIVNFFNTLCGTAVRTVYEIHANMEEVFGVNYSIHKKLNECHSISDRKLFITGIFEQITGYINAKRKKQNQKVYDRILEYIHENYSSDISLNTVGDAVGLSLQYVSWIFKETSGVNFIDYLNSYRVEKARELLMNSDLPVLEVAKRVGYNNTNNFIRVFKKYAGVTPGQFRESAGV